MTDDSHDATPAVWKHDFTVDNLIDYARASRDLSAYVRVLAKDGFGQLMVPSRGAVPFVRAASSAWHMDARVKPTREARFEASMELTGSPFFEKLELPFSADPQDAGQTTAAIRTYWSRVLAAIVRRDGTDPRLVFYKTLVEKLAKRKWLACLPRDLPKDKFIFVDTVISGRAIFEIFEAFADAGLTECHFLLIVDANGDEIAPRYRRVIDDMVHSQRCTLIPVERLFTEDRGPAVSGVWSTVYPQVLDAVRRKFPWAADAYGAGTFYHQVSSSQVEPKQGIGDVEYNMPVTVTYATLSTGIFAAMQALQQKDRVAADLGSTAGSELAEPDPEVARPCARIDFNLRRLLQHELQAFRDTLAELEPLTTLDKRTTKTLAEPRVRAAHPNAEVGVSSSHLVRVTLPASEIEDFMREAERDLASGQDVLKDEWIR